MKQFLFLILVCYSSIFIAQVPDYYNDVNLSLTGADLKAALATKITNTHTNNLSYTPGIWEASKITDINPDNSNEVLLVYGYENGTDDNDTNNKVAGKNEHPELWNREHVYPQSLGVPNIGTSGPGADAHSLRPCNPSRNSSRGNRKFSDSSGTASGAAIYTFEDGSDETGWYPGDEWIGDVARMMMYMYLRYGDQTLPTNVGLGDSSATFDDMIDLFLSWNVQDPVSAFELQRNTYHDSDETYAQGNRNPFIDNPYFATLIWGGPLAEDKFGDVTDSESPTKPTNVSSSLITGTSFYISWTASTDNAFVTGYKVFLNSVEVGTTNSTNYNATGLSDSTSYSVTIEAYDPTGNTSSASSSIIVNTGADDTITSDLYISEYIEGSSFNKALEIVNYTGASVDLSSYTLKKQSNGAGSWSGTPLALSGTLANGDVYVIAHASAASAILDEADLTPSSAVVSFNGNDPIGLFKDDGLIDIVGVFDDSTVFGENTTLQRKFTTTSPTNSYNSNEWVSLASDTFSRLGSHIVTGTNTFLEITDTNWSTVDNWSFNVVPSSGDDVIISVNKTINTSENISLGNITLENNASLTISSGAVTVNTAVINSGASLIAEATFTGTVTYKRNLTAISGDTEGWHLVASPVSGETYDDAYVTAEGIASGSGNNRGIASYVTNGDLWDYMQAGESFTFTSGHGYAMKRATTGQVKFIGNLNTDDLGVDATISTAGNGFNLLGNPYTAFINNQTFLTDNTNIDQQIWVWDQTEGNYEVKIDGAAFEIAPGQGFFVKANSGTAVNFAESNQSAQGTDTFLRTNSWTEVKLLMTDGEKNRFTKLYFTDNATTGFDAGWEGEVFGGIQNEIDVFTHLVEESQGKKYQVQSLPLSDLESLVIPLGVTVEAGKTATFSIENTNVPSNINVYIEDKQDNSFTLLEADANFSFTPENNLDGIGRFYIHTTTSSLSAADFGFKNTLSIYTSSRENLRVVGVQNGTANIQLYNILGKEVLKSSFEGNGVNDIALPKLNSGVYIVKIATETGTTNKKIIIQ
jgi:endonuclease I